MRKAVLASIALAASTAAAQTPPAQTDVSAAAEAFRQGQRAQLAREYARAAELFELADQAAPSPAALRSAIRNHQAAGHGARAATVALFVLERDAADPQSAQLARTVIDEAAPRFTRVLVACAPACTVTVDRLAVSQSAATSHGFFVEPGARAVQARWSGLGERSRDIEGLAGQRVELSFEAPPPPPPAPEPPPPTPSPPPEPVIAPTTPTPGVTALPTEAPRLRRRRPLSPAIFWIVTGATAVTGGLLVWSHLSTLSARDAYTQRPTQESYDEGVSRQTRTTAFAATTVTLGVAAAVIGIFFTEWGGRRVRWSDAMTAPTLGVQEGRWTLGVVRTF